jgi:hypothetical protein
MASDTLEYKVERLLQGEKNSVEYFCHCIAVTSDYRCIMSTFRLLKLHRESL